MRINVMMLLILACFVGVVGAAEQPGEALPKGVALLRVGSFDDAMTERVRHFLEKNLSIPVSMLDERKLSGGSLEEETLTATQAMRPRDICLIVLVSPAADMEAQSVLLSDKMVAGVNTLAFKPADGDREVYGRRLERLAIRSVSALLGMQPCPNPRCALFQYENLSVLDRIGRNLCPPCLGKTQKAAEKRGIKLINRGMPLLLPKKQ